jgi:putative sigma-54 modulation protein
VKFDADQRLVDFVETKMAKLEKFSERIISSDVILRVDKDHEKGNKTVTMTLYMPGEDLIAKARARSFEEAVDDAVEELRTQIIKQKEKMAAV